jgi:predicted DNA repair protein MutK
MSGLLALLDDVAAIAKVAAAPVDDIAGQAAKAGAKAAGALIDDAAVTPKYVTGFAPARELPIVGKIALGSIRNKLLILLPAGLLLSAFAPWLVSPLLMLGGAYLCFEGAEKIWHALFPHDHVVDALPVTPGSAARLEETKVAGAIKTDFILSAEIMTIALAAIPHSTLWMDAATLAVVAVGVTVAVYGSVALIVKADDLGLAMGRRGRWSVTRKLGCGLVRMMPGFLRLLTIVGTAAMLWVGGNIVVHGMHSLGWHPIYDFIHHWAGVAGAAMPEGLTPTVTWIARAAMDGVFGLALGLVLIPIGTRLVAPLWRAVFGDKA